MLATVFLVVLVTPSGDMMYVTNNAKGYTAQSCMVEAPKQLKLEAKHRKYHHGLVHGDPYLPAFNPYHETILERFGNSISYKVEWDHKIPTSYGCISYNGIIDSKFNKDLSRFNNTNGETLYLTEVMTEK
jgi:hypothetical protein